MTRRWDPTDAERAKIEEMLADSASYQEISSVIGKSRKSICRRYPGHGWSLEQRLEFIMMRRAAKKAGIRL